MTVIVAQGWLTELERARAGGARFFDWLGVVDSPEGDGYDVVVHLWSGQHVTLRTRVPREAPELDSATVVFPGAAWHEREAAEMFGLTFRGHPDPRPLLLATQVDGPQWPLRREVRLAARRAQEPPSGQEPLG